MVQLIDKDRILAEIEKQQRRLCILGQSNEVELRKNVAIQNGVYCSLLSFLDALEVIDPYEQCIQYASIEGGIKAHAEIYSFNIESELFPQLTKEQQKLWRKEIEGACISGGDAGYSLAKDPRYKENLEVKEVDLDKEVDDVMRRFLGHITCREEQLKFAKHFFELGIQAQKGE